MRDKTSSIAERLQYDTSGELVGTLIECNGVQRLLLEPGFMLVKDQSTGRVRVWGGKNNALVELAK